MAESLWDIFNKVCLIYKGRMVYFGPIGLAQQYYIPQTALEFEEYYKNSEIRKMNLEDICLYKAVNVDKQDRKLAFKECQRGVCSPHLSHG